MAFYVSIFLIDPSDKYFLAMLVIRVLDQSNIFV